MVQTVVILLLGVVIAFFRIGGAALRGVVWAEDGQVFLSGAYQHPLHLLAPYAGYANVFPRLVAAVISQFPIGSHGFLICLAGAFVQAGVAAYAFHALRAHTRGRIPALLVALLVVAVPVGPEVVDNIANAQWFLVFGACLAPLWQPAGRAGRVASVLLVLFAVLSSPIGVLAVIEAGLVWFLTRRRELVVLLAVGLIGVLVQVSVMVTAPPRDPIPSSAGWNLLDLSAVYLLRVVGDGVFGIGSYDQYRTATNPLRAIAVLVVFTMLVRHARRSGYPQLGFVGLAVTLSVLTFVIPAFFARVQPNTVPSALGRYYVGPALFLGASLAVLIDVALINRGMTRDGRTTVWPRVLAGCLVAAIGFGVVSSWSTPGLFRRGQRSWSASIESARERCAADHSLQSVGVVVAPVGWRRPWMAQLPCTRLSAVH